MMSRNKLILSALIALSAVLIVSCSTTNKAVQMPDKSTNTETSVRYERIIETDTVYITIPKQTAERTTYSGQSHLENDYAVSDARINDDGSLYHSLETKEQEKPVEVQSTHERTDSVATKTEYIKVPVEVEKKLTWWQQTQLATWWYITIAAAIAIALLAASYRKTLSKIFSWLISLVKRLF